MTCVACSSAIEKGLRSELKGKGLVDENSVSVILLVHKLKIALLKDVAARHLVTPDRIIIEVEDLGFGAKLISTFEVLEREVNKDNALESFRSNRSNMNEENQVKSQIFVITGMTCAACSGSIERHFMSSGPNQTPMVGISSINISLLTNKAVVSYDPRVIKQRDIISEIEDLGFEAEVQQQSSQVDIRDIVRAEVSKYQQKVKVSLLLYLPMAFLIWIVPYYDKLMPLMLSYILWNGNPTYLFVLFAISTIYLFYIGIGFFKSAFKSLKH
mmetsp:Transcript_1220/g.2228  ORF Transcript_1220/g.2228 Transcript_1220/m.2228 type:complete len:271 (+) Transcript_1220:242-1054(+)